MDRRTEPQPPNPGGPIGSIEIHNVRVRRMAIPARTTDAVVLAWEDFPDGAKVPIRVIDPRDLKRIEEASRRPGIGDRRVGTIRMLQWWYEGMTTGYYCAPIGPTGFWAKR